jgi:PKD repeat protein
MASIGASSAPPADAYKVNDLPPVSPTYCHPEMDGTVWPNQPSNCGGKFIVSNRYDCCNPDGSLINYQGMNFSRATIGLTHYGSLSTQVPTFTVTATPAPDGPPNGDMRVRWERLEFRVARGGQTTNMYADPVTTCEPEDLTCTFRIDPTSLAAVMGARGLGDPPSWQAALINVDVNTSQGCCAPYGWSAVAVGFYMTDNRAPEPGAQIIPNEDQPGVSFHFNGSSSFDPDNEPIVRYHWEFGDGTTAEGKIVDHTYAKEGAYTAKLFVLDDDGAQSELSVDLGKSITMELEAGGLPKADGDTFSITAKLTNHSSQALWCMNVSPTPDIRPKASFTEVSRPPTWSTNTIPRGGSVTGTWTFKLKGPPPPELYFFGTGFGGGFGPNCPGQGKVTVSAERTWQLGGAQPWEPFANWTGLVKQQHLDVLGRVPTSSESSSWVAKLTAGTSTAADLVHSLRRSTDNQANVDATARLYKALLGRTPDKSGLTFWIGRRRAGTWTLVRMADNFAGSTEFKRKYGTLTNRQYVTRIYTDVLGRAADPSGVDYWTRQLDLKRRTRGSVMVGFSESNEYKTKQAEATDGSIAYLFLLGRTPTADELQAWVTDQKAGTTHQDLLAELLASAAYRARFPS